MVTSLITTAEPPLFVRQDEDHEQVRKRAHRWHEASSGACRRPQGTGNASEDGRDSRREGDPQSPAHVAALLCGVVPYSAGDPEKLGTGEALPRCACRCVSARDTASTEGSHGSRGRMTYASARFI